ncbi:hypothetical protein I6B53_01085 [Schaalia sp. 19OD2882]|uniref:hypothetical protein n=1 Tax=Schaalia sp. 19OD2882 TaxID=2794089 RepID=UPI001C1E9B59|nr:hypothetical protein [Schaalia sp. 19OD2882]QWW19760.1 hypothetical protein I6B53_01085 [Schaalia sp. 19OD2882]
MTSTPDTTGAPVRRSLKERMARAEAPTSTTSTAGKTPGRANGTGELPALGNTGATPVVAFDPLTSTTTSSSVILTDTTTNALGAHVVHDHAFRVGTEGDVAADQAAALVAPLERTAPLAPIDRHTATGHHLLAVNSTVEPDELEALAVSVWEGAGWTAPGTLRLSGGARLEGPWSLPTELRREFGIPAEQDTVWLLVCAPNRAQFPPRPNLFDRWANAFPKGVPCGVEAKMLLTMERMARRLAGTIRIAGSGVLIEPDPDSAVSLTVHAPRWLDPEEALALLVTEFPDTIDARDIVPERGHAIPKRRDLERVDAVREGLPEVPAEVARAIESDRRRDLEAGQLLDGYSLVTPVGNKSRMALEVRPAGEVVPQALRWETWASGPIIEYKLRWLPAEGVSGAPSSSATSSAVPDARHGLTRAARLERVRAAADIERAAALVQGAVGGAILDEDGFLVGLG